MQEEHNTSGKGPGHSDCCLWTRPAPAGGGGAGSHPTTSFVDPTHRPDPPRPSCPGSFRHPCPPPIPTTASPVWGLCPEPCCVQPDPQGLPSLPKAPRPPPLDLVHPGPTPRPGQRGWESGACALGAPAPGTWDAGIPPEPGCSGVLKCVDRMWTCDPGHPHTCTTTLIALDGAP